MPCRDRRNPVVLPHRGGVSRQTSGPGYPRRSESSYLPPSRASRFSRHRPHRRLFVIAQGLRGSMFVSVEVCSESRRVGLHCSQGFVALQSIPWKLIVTFFTFGIQPPPKSRCETRQHEVFSQPEIPRMGSLAHVLNLLTAASGRETAMPPPGNWR